jgi:hypothetical protein
VRLSPFALCDKYYFLQSRKPLYLRFPLESHRERGARFDIGQFHWSAGSGVLRSSLAAVMLVDVLLYTGGRACVEGLVGAFYNVDKTGHDVTFCH